MAKKQKHEHHEEHVDESWLIPYADLLTLLLALFIVLFASSQVDQKKLDQMSEAMHGAFSGGKGFFEYFGVVQPMRNTDPDSDNRESSEQTDPFGSTEDETDVENPSEMENQLSQAEKLEQKQLEDLKEKLDSYIEANGLSTQLETKQADYYVMITIRDQALFASGSADMKQEARMLAAAVADILTAYPEYEVAVSGHTDDVPISSGAYRSNWDLSTARSLNFMKELFRNPNVNQKRFSSTGYGEYRPIADNGSSEGRAKNRRVEVNIISPALKSSKAIPAQ